jgi:redox-sensitive bicupin YhaK (pirin superfamily)
VDRWINLSKRKKGLEPAYLHISSFQLPTISLDKAIMKVLAGGRNDESYAVIAGVPMVIMHLILEAGAETKVAIPSCYQACMYVLKGYGLFGEEAMDAVEGKMVLFNNEGEIIPIKAPASKPLEVILLSKESFREPIVTYGPFVMNSIDEIYEDMIDYSSGRMGSITLLDTQKP